MTKLFGRESARWRQPALLALLAATVALAAGAQALSPAPAAALQIECVEEEWNCGSSDQGGEDPSSTGSQSGSDQGSSDDDGSAWESGNADPPNGDGVGADNGFGQDDSSAKNDDGGIIPAGDPFADRKGTDSSQGNPPWLPSGSSRSPWETVKRLVWRRECRRLRGKVKDLIKWHYGDDADFDKVTGSGDEQLDAAQDALGDLGCGGTLRLGRGRHRH